MCQSFSFTKAGMDGLDGGTSKLPPPPPHFCIDKSVLALLHPATQPPLTDTTFTSIEIEFAPNVHVRMLEIGMNHLHRDADLGISPSSHRLQGAIMSFTVALINTKLISHHVSLRC